MNCQRCNSKRTVEVSAKCSDMFSARLDDNEYDGYVPQDLGISAGVGGGDYIAFSYCLECGQLQGNFPMGGAAIEKETTYDDVLEFFANHFNEGEKIAGFSMGFKRDCLDRAKEMSSKFYNFLRYFFQYNANSNFPAAERFATMYTDNMSCLEESER